jgi:hypothetical protein
MAGVDDLAIGAKVLIDVVVVNRGVAVEERPPLRKPW